MKNEKELDEKQTAAMDTEKLQGILKSEMDDATDYIDQIGEARAEATDYYLGNEPEVNSSLQSEFISTDVRDSILFMLPSIMRTFFGTKKVVEFVPQNAEDIPLAENKQITSIILFNKRILVLKFFTMRLKMLWLESLALLKLFGMILFPQLRTNTLI